MSPRTIGVLGGTFDPVHRGHVAWALAARAALGLGEVALLPCATPPHKPDRRIAPAYERLEMLYLALAGRPGLSVATDEMARGGVCYTIDTLRGMRAQGLAPVFLLGSDALAEIETWRDHHALLAEFDLAVVLRAGDDLPWPPAVRERLAVPPPADLGAGGRVVRVGVEVPEVASRLIRARVAAGQPIADLVPAAVDRYIQVRRLYRLEEAR